MRKHRNKHIEVFKVSSKVLLVLQCSIKLIESCNMFKKTFAKCENFYEKYFSLFVFRET